MTAVSPSFLRINTVVILLGDVIRDNPCMVQAEIEGVRFVGIKSSQICSLNFCLFRVNML